MVVVAVVPSKLRSEIGDGLAVIQESTGILRSSFHSAEGRFDIRIVIRSPEAGKQLRHVVVLEEFLDRLGFHLATTVIDHFGSLILR